MSDEDARLRRRERDRARRANADEAFQSRLARLRHDWVGCDGIRRAAAACAHHEVGGQQI